MEERGEGESDRGERRGDMRGPYFSVAATSKPPPACTKAIITVLMVHPLKNKGSCHTTTTIATREKRREEEEGQQDELGGDTNPNRTLASMRSS